MPVQVAWINHASFRIQAGQNVLYIDPWKIPSPAHDADVVFVSHNHYDHCSPPDIQKVANADTVVVCPADTVAKIGSASAVDPGQEITVKAITVQTVAAYNIGKAFHPRGQNWCGAVFTIGGKRIYYAGDTDLIPEMSNLKDIDLALLPIGGTYTLDARQAAKAVEAIGCAAAVPYHWGDIVGTQADADAFAQAVGDRARVLKPGGVLTLDP